MALELYSNIILEMAKQGLSSEVISEHLSREYGEARGFSARNIRKFCAENVPGCYRLSDTHLELEVAKAVNEVRHL